MENKQKLKIAIQKSGRLNKDSQALLEQCGLKIRWQENKLITIAENMDIDILRVRDDDIPGLVFDGLVDLGVVGENVLTESKLLRKNLRQTCDYELLRKLDFGFCRLSIAIPTEEHYSGVDYLNGKRIASSYPFLLKQFMTEHNLKYTNCSLTGSVEIATRAGLADAICDLVSSGATLEANGLKEVKVIYKSQACLIKNPTIFSDFKDKLLNKLLIRIHGVIQARESKYIMMHVPKKKLDLAMDLLPGIEDPTILPLAHNQELVALHVVSKESLFWETMENLKSIGASSILVLPIDKMME